MTSRTWVAVTSVAERPARSTGGVRAQQVGNIHRQHDLLVTICGGQGRHRLGADQGFEPVCIQAPVVDSVEQRPITAGMFGFQAQVGQIGDIALGAEQRVGEFEQGIGADFQALVVALPEHVEPIQKAASCTKYGC